MGNQNAKKSEKNLFTSEELKILEQSYKAMAGTLEKLNDEKLIQNWTEYIDSHLAQCTTNYILKQNPSCVTFKSFAEPYYIVEHCEVKEKVKFIAFCLDENDSQKFAIKELEHYISSVMRSYVLLQSNPGNEIFESWKVHGYSSTERTVVSFAKALTRSLTQDGEHRLVLDKLENWINQNPMFLTLWREVFSYLYSRNAGKHGRLGNDMTSGILPVLEGLKSGTNYSPILDIPHVIFINSNLPNELRRKWRFLFSSKIMGESFSTMLGRIIQKGPTLLIVEDEDRYIFAGFAPSDWIMSPKFLGDDSSMLFTLSPAMRCFNATGYNDHYQYLNLNQQTMPNGLGMGGQYNYWGLWLDSEYGQGQSSESCTTYSDYMQLSKRKEFKIRNLEVFALGDEPKNEDEDENQHKSVLDRNLEDRVILELSGKNMHSDGLREPEMDL